MAGSPVGDGATGGRVLILDRAPVYAAGVQAVLAAAGIPALAVSLDEAVARAGRAGVRCVVLDAGLARSSEAPALVGRIAARAPEVPIVVVVAAVRPAGLVQLLEAGGRALVHRRCSPAELVAAVRAAETRHSWVSGTLRGELLAESVGGGDVALTPREREVMVALAAGGSNAEIGRRLGISEHTVRNHLRAATAKLGVRNRTDALATAVRRGIVELSEAEQG